MYTSFTFTTKVIYNSPVSKKCRDPGYITKWSKNYPGSKSAHNELWSNISKTPYTIIRGTNLQSFQYKIIHQLIACTKILFDMKLVDNAKCKYCHELDNISHFFLFCLKEYQYFGGLFSPGGII